MEESKANEIKAHAEGLVTEGCNLNNVANEIMIGYIFGGQADKTSHNFGVSEHYQIDEILALVGEKYNELYPPEVVGGG